MSTVLTLSMNSYRQTGKINRSFLLKDCLNPNGPDELGLKVFTCVHLLAPISIQFCGIPEQRGSSSFPRVGKWQGSCLADAGMALHVWPGWWQHNFLAVNLCGFKEFWGLPQVEALLTSVPRGRLLVLDLDSTDRQDLQPHQSFTFFSGSSTQELLPTQGNHSFSTWSTHLVVR